MGKKIMIVGANFDDKGSQAKLYIVIDELRKRFSDCEIFYAHSGEQFDDALYRFRKILYTKKVQAQVLKFNPLTSLSKMFHKKDDSSTNDTANLIPQMDLIIDVSEHLLTSDSSMQDIQFYLDNIRIAKKFKIPMIIMPQSFGPFDFNIETMYILGDMKDLLFYPKAIFAREQYGYDELMGYFGLDNLRRSTDMLLPNEDFTLPNVLTRFYKPRTPEIPEGNNVAVIPNAVLFSKKYYDKTMDLYQKLFEVLQATEKTVYIVSQTSSDMDICKSLFNRFKNYSNLTIIEEDLDCVELNMILKNFEIVISSHYAGCVQAYRNFIPVLLLGSGVKYKELTELLGQEKLYFDILSEESNNFDIADALVKLIDDEDIAKTRIQTRMLDIQTKNCFGIFDELKW